MIPPLSHTDLTLETDRLILTPFTHADIDIATAVLCDPDVMRYVSDAMTPEAVAEHMPDATKRGAGGRIGIWCITRKDTGQKIGDGVLIPVPIEDHDTDWSQVVPDAYPTGQIEVGYLLIPDAWGQGFATEVCTRLVKFVFEETTLSDLVAVTDPDNHNSQHVLQKSGLRSIGKKRAYAEDDVSWFEITRDDWETKPSQ